MNEIVKNKCVKLRSAGVSYDKIGEIVGISSSSVRYNLDENVRKKMYYNLKNWRKNNPEKARILYKQDSSKYRNSFKGKNSMAKCYLRWALKKGYLVREEVVSILEEVGGLE